VAGEGAGAGVEARPTRVRMYGMRPVAAALNFNDNLFDETGRHYSLARISRGGPVAGNFLITTHSCKYSSNENSIRATSSARNERSSLLLVRSTSRKFPVPRSPMTIRRNCDRRSQVAHVI
jgi:hypothetical protein